MNKTNTEQDQLATGEETIQESSPETSPSSFLDVWFGTAVTALGLIEIEMIKKHIDVENSENKCTLLCIAIGMMYRTFEAALYDVNPELRELRDRNSGLRFLRALADIGLINTNFLDYIDEHFKEAPSGNFSGFYCESPPVQEQNMDRHKKGAKSVINGPDFGKILHDVLTMKRKSVFLDAALEAILVGILAAVAEQVNIENPEDRQNLLCLALVLMVFPLEGALYQFAPELRNRHFAGGEGFLMTLRKFGLISSSFDDFRNRTENIVDDKLEMVPRMAEAWESANNN
jgi:hypothetical protein